MNSNETIKQAARAGPGPGVPSIHPPEVAPVLKSLAIPDVEGFPVMQHRYIVHRNGKRFTVIARTFDDFTINEAPSLPGLPAAEHAA